MHQEDLLQPAIFNIFHHAADASPIYGLQLAHILMCSNLSALFSVHQRLQTSVQSATKNVDFWTLLRLRVSLLCFKPWSALIPVDKRDTLPALGLFCQE